MIYYNNVANICKNYILGFNSYRVCSEDDVMEVFNQITCDRMVSQDCEKLNKFLNRTLCDDVYPKFDNENNIGWKWKYNFSKFVNYSIF